MLVSGEATQTLSGHEPVFAAGLSHKTGALTEGLQTSRLDAKILQRVSIVDTPGVTSDSKGIQSFIQLGHLADLVLLLVDSHNLIFSRELRAILEQMRPHFTDAKLVIVFSKADELHTGEQILECREQLRLSLRDVGFEKCDVYFWSILANDVELLHATVLSSIRERIPGYGSLALHHLAVLRSSFALFGGNPVEHPFSRFRRRLSVEIKLVASDNASKFGRDQQLKDVVDAILNSVRTGEVDLWSIPSYNRHLIGELNKILDGSLLTGGGATILGSKI
ncbi:hypothetical protein HDU93_009927 [Gonapodya sp. JEL0774]|nr:hypothetical protein HDU93_009927 [Gonapodya sp. JEL0774]